jgi:ribosome biogenesis protein BMS1
MVNELVGSHLGMYRRGKYVKVILKNVEESTQIDSPLILARVNVGEDNLGYLKVRIKRHRWYSNILKSNDPVVVSVGWRRFQTMPVFCVEDPNDRIRFIKYSPQWDYSLAILYGCFAPQGTGLCVTQTLSSDVSKFRIAATGTVLELNHSFDVMKKLKLVGTPYRIYKNSALIRGMLNSTLEVAKF